MHRKAPVTAAVENYICITFLYNDVNKTITSCARGDTICPRPLQVDSIFAFIHQSALEVLCDYALYKSTFTFTPGGSAVPA